jgi:hypothetical protein
MIRQSKRMGMVFIPSLLLCSATDPAFSQRIIQGKVGGPLISHAYRCSPLSLGFLNSWFCESVRESFSYSQLLLMAPLLTQHERRHGNRQRPAYIDVFSHPS